jgi:hypothetical protein
VIQPIMQFSWKAWEQWVTIIFCFSSNLSIHIEHVSL